MENSYRSHSPEQDSRETSHPNILAHPGLLSNSFPFISRSVPCIYSIASLSVTFHSANESDLTNLLRPLGLHSIRAKRLINQSKAYLQDPPSSFDLRTSKTSLTKSNRGCGRYPPTPISHLPGTGPYALDSYRIFCTADCQTNEDEWKSVMPADKELIRYLVGQSNTTTSYVNVKLMFPMFRNGSGPSKSERSGRQE